MTADSAKSNGRAVSGDSAAGVDAGGNGIELRKEIGVLQGISIIVGIIVGSGIFVSPKGILEASGSVGFSFVMWAVTGLFSLLGAICYAEIGTAIPRSGGEYIYVLQTIGRLPAFLILWIIFVAIGCGSTAANSLLFAKYCLAAIYYGCEVPEYLTRLVAFLSITILCAINCINVKWATKTSVVISCCKVGALLCITCIGIYHLCLGKTENFENAFDGSNYGIGTISAFYQGFWAFAGWNYLNFLTEEMKQPSRSLPMAIGISMPLITIVYITANVGYLAVLTPSQLMASHAVAVTFAERSMGPVAFLMPLMVAIAIFGSMNGEVLSISRLVFTGAAEDQLPAVLAMVNFTRYTPMPSILCFGILTLVLQQVFTHQLDYLIELTGFAFILIALAAFTCLLIIRYKFPDVKRPLKLPIALPIFVYILTAGISLITLIKSPYKSLMSVGIMLSGLPFYLIGVVWRKKPKSVQSNFDKITGYVQKLLLVIPQQKSV